MMAEKPLIDQDTRDKVNRIDQRVEEVVLPALENMQKQFDKLSVVPMATYVEDKKNMLAEIEILKEKARKAEPAVKFYSAITSRLSQVIVTVIVGGLLYLLAQQISKIGIL